MGDLLLYLHLTFLALAVVGIIIADRAAFSWMRGKTEVVGKKSLFTAHWIVTTGLLGLVYTGLFLFWPMREFLLTQPLFLFKLAIIATMLVNGMVIDWLMHVAAVRSYASLTSNQKAPLLISGAVSGLGWLGIVTAAWFQFGWLF
jgi:hypothetical protein